MPGGGACFVNSNHAIYDAMFARAIHKCAANVLCKYFSSNTTRKWYQELIDFVTTGKNPCSWSYAISYQANMRYRISPQEFYPLWTVDTTPVLVEPLPKEPETHSNPCWGVRKGFVPIAVSFVDTSGIYLVGTLPNILTKPYIQFASEFLSKQSEHDSHKLGLNEDKLRDIFNSSVLPTKKSTIGDLNFLWVKKQIEPSNNSSDMLRVLVMCKICGQINPTGHYVSRKMINTKNSQQTTRRSNNGWNRLTLDDLRARGLQIKKWHAEDIARMLSNGIDYPTENHNRMFPAKGEIRCMSCNCYMWFSRENCFL